MAGAGRPKRKGMEIGSGKLSRRTGTPPGTAVVLESFYEDAVHLDPEAFGGRHGSGFLLVTAATSGDPNQTTSTYLLLDDEQDVAGHTAGLATLVYPLRAKDGAKGYLVTLGRSPQHDVVIPSSSISRFHAFAKRGSDGVFLLQDAGSTNGTTVNGHTVPARGAGAPVPVKPGDTVQFGQVQCTFTDAPGLQSFVRQAGG